MRIRSVARTGQIALVVLLATTAAAGEAIAQVPSDSSWAVCVTAPKRRCVLDEALQLAQSIPEEKGRGIGLASIAAAQAKTGNIGDALQLAQSIKVEIKRATALGAIAEAQAKAGKISEALQQAQSIADDDARGLVLGTIAEAQARAGLTTEAEATFKQALQLAQSIKDEMERAMALGVIGGALMNGGFTKEAVASFETALQLAQSIRDGTQRATALSAIAISQANAGKIGDALQLAQSLKDKWGRAMALASIAEAQVNAGVPKEAVATLDHAIKQAEWIADRRLQVTAFGVIAGARARVGKIDDALRLARSMKIWPAGVAALATIADAQGKAGLTKEAAATFKEALHLAQSIKDKAERIITLSHIAEALPN